MSDGGEVEAIASSHLPPMSFFWELWPKCFHTNALSITLIHHANCQTCPLSAKMGLPILTRTLWRCGRRDTRQIRGGSARRSRELKQLLFAVGTSPDSGEYYVISIESEDANMSIKKSILTTLAITLIATAPA